MISAFGVEHSEELSKSIPLGKGRLKPLKTKPYEHKPYPTRTDKVLTPMTEAAAFAAHPKQYVNELRIARKTR